jgi:cell division protein FtsW
MPSERPAETFRARSIATPVAVIVVCAIGLTFLGLTILFSASVSLKQDPYFYLHKQVAGVAVAALLCFVVSRVNLDYARRASKGVSVKGSRRWLGYGAARLQVSEFAKLAMVFCLAHYLALNQTRIGDWKRGYLYPLGIIGSFAGLILLEPDFGTAALALSVGLLLLFLAGAKWRYMIPTVALSAAAFALMVEHNPNRLRRFTAFMDVEANRQGGTYQLYQSLEAFAAGGTTGAGLGEGRQQINFLPEAHTDFIFAVVGEELGMWFTLAVVAVFAVMFVAGLAHLRRAPNLFHFLLAAGCLLLMCLQSIINLGVVTGVLPTKGMSLPFISAGLSNLLLMGLLIGVLINTQRVWGRAVLPDGAMREVLQ